MKFDLVLIDGMNIVKKSEWAFRTLKDSLGRSTGIIFGVLSSIIKCLDSYSDEVVVLWDSPDLKKKLKDSNYKAGRKKDDSDDFFKTVFKLKSMIELLGVKQIHSFGYEADDIASKIIRENPTKKILLSTSDSDWRLFSNKNVSFLDKNEIKSYDNFYGEEKDFSCPERDLFFQAITGNHNNVKGIFGINKKNVLDIIKSAENIEDIFEGEGSKEKDLIKENKDFILENVKMIKGIDSGYDIEVNEGKKDIRNFIEVCKNYEMFSLVKRVVVLGL